MFDEAEFHKVADAFIAYLADTIEEADEDALLECEVAGGVLTIESETKKTWVVSKHAPSKQIWLASPFSGGLHFSYEQNAWKLPDGRELANILAAELNTHAGVEVAL